MEPLQDIEVVDLSQNFAGPTCTQILADLGAQVVKVEPPAGDSARAWGPPFWGQDSALFMTANRGKRSVVLDLKSDRGAEVLHRLLASADVFVQTFRAGVVERLGLDHESLRARYPGLIYVTVSAFGSEGPRKDQPGYDPLMQAYAGLMSMTGTPGAPPARAGASVIDATTGMWAGLSVLAALRHRDRTGEGSHVVVSLLDSALALVSYKLTGYLADGVVPGPMGSAFGSIVPYEAFPTTGGNVMIAAANDALYARLCRALDRLDLVDDERYRTNPDRVHHRRELVETLSAVTATLTSAELMGRLHEHGVPYAPIQDVSQLADDPQVRATEMLRSPTHAEHQGYRDVAFPARFDGTRPSAEGVPPTLGRDTAHVLAELGYSAEDIAELLEAGVAG